jgi:hypothetical protein
MLATGVRQLRYAFSMLTDHPFSTNDLHKIVADLRVILTEFGDASAEATELLMVADTDGQTQQDVARAPRPGPCTMLPNVRCAIGSGSPRTA